MQVSLSELILLPMLFHLLVILICWLYYLAKEGAPQLGPSHNRIYRCQVCEHVYLDARDVPLARCPRCGCLNEAVKT